MCKISKLNLLISKLAFTAVKAEPSVGRQICQDFLTRWLPIMPSYERPCRSETPLLCHSYCSSCALPCDRTKQISSQMHCKLLGKISPSLERMLQMIACSYTKTSQHKASAFLSCKQHPSFNALSLQILSIRTNSIAYLF